MSDKSYLSVRNPVFTHLNQNFSFICLDPQVRDKMNLRVNSISAPEESCSKRTPSRNIESLRWGKINCLSVMTYNINKLSLFVCVRLFVLFVYLFLWPMIFCFVCTFFLLIFLFFKLFQLVGVSGSSPTYVRCSMPLMRWWVISVTSTGCMTFPWAMIRLKPWLKR